MTSNQALRTEQVTKSFTTKETAQLIRQALKKAFPGQKFSVTTKYGSCYSATDISWMDGPTQPEVELITNQFTSKGFDGMTDSTTYHYQVFNGETVSFSGWVNCQRRVSPALLEKALLRANLEIVNTYGLKAIDLHVVPNGTYPYLEGPDKCRPSGLFNQYCDAFVYEFAHKMRGNGQLVTLKGGR